MDNDYMRSSLELLMQKASHIIKVSELITYLGFPAPGTTLISDSSWAVCKVEKDQIATPNITTIKWANGQRQKNLKMSDYLALNYYYPKF